MLTVGTVAAGAPSDAAAMTGHLLNQTLPREAVAITRYYGRSGDAASEDAGATTVELRPDIHPLVAKGLDLDAPQPLTKEQINGLLAGRRADGKEIQGKRYGKAYRYTDPRTGEVKESIPLGSVDFTLAPDKSVSLAWAFGRPAEQAAIYTAHREAAHETMLYIAERIGQARIGDGGKDGADPGHIGWLAFDHYTARPTVWLARDENGERITEAIPVKIAGDPDLHTHFIVMNAVFCENGRVGALDLAKMHGMIKEAGAYYQAHLATKLRTIGANVMLDPDTGMARLPAIPPGVRDHFSKKTRNGEEAARQYAKEKGLDWDSLSEERRVKLLKGGTQATIKTGDEALNEKLKKDDLADFASWRRQADDLGWKHDSIMAYGPPPPPLTPEQWMNRVQETAEPWLEKELDKRAVIGEPDVRTAALRGMIAHGIDHSGDIDEMVSRFMRDGVTQQGERTALIAEDGVDDRRHARFTTTLHEAQEKEFIGLAQRAAGDRGGSLGTVSIAMAIERSGLTFEGDHGRAQKGAIYQLGQGGKLGV